MSTVSYNCPNCGAPLAFSAASGKLECAACGSGFEPEALEILGGQEEDREDLRFEAKSQALGDGDGMDGYVCQNCGAELLTEDNTTATECPYCGSPTILPDRLEGGVRPEIVVPFKVSKEEAQRKFTEYFDGKKMMPNVFLSTSNRIAEMRKLYVPYWVFSCDAYGDISFDGEKKRKERQGDTEIERIQHYAVRRAGGMRFEGIPVQASKRLDKKISESLEPYRLNEAVDFQPAVLSGAMADRADVGVEAGEARVAERVERSMEDTLRASVSGYEGLKVKRRSIYTDNGYAVPALMPVWLITTEKEVKGEKKTYTFAINGQTGELTCDVPADGKKVGGWFAAVAGGITLVGLAALLLAKAPMSWMFLVVIGALIAGAVVTSTMSGKLKTATEQRSAAAYADKGSLSLDVKVDKFLYEETKRRTVNTGSGSGGSAGGAQNAKPAVRTVTAGPKAAPKTPPKK